MQVKLLEKFNLFKDWLVQSKNWQLRLVIIFLATPFLITAFFIKAGTGLPLVALAFSILALTAPKLRTNLKKLPQEQAITGLVVLLISLVVVTFSSMIVVWGHPLMSQSLLVFGNSFFAFRKRPSALNKPATYQNKKKKENKKQKSRRLKGSK